MTSHHVFGTSLDVLVILAPRRMSVVALLTLWRSAHKHKQWLEHGRELVNLQRNDKGTALLGAGR